MDERRSGMKERGYDKLFSDITIEELSHKIVRLAKQRDEWQEKAMNMIEKSTYEELNNKYKNYKKLAEDNFISSVNDSETSDIWKERYEKEVSKAEFWKDSYYNNQPKGCGYMFSEIPNDTDGQEFVDTMKKYFNKKTYKMRVRGQHIKPELRGTGATYWGQSKAESTHMRIYIDIK
jgi:Mn-containing catalase